MRQRTTQLVLLGFAALMMSFPLLLFAWVLTQLGGDVPSFVTVERVRSVVAMAWLGATAFVAVRTVNYRGDLDAPSGLLTTAAVRDVVAGTMLAEAAVLSAWAAVPLAVLAGSFAVGVRTVAPALALPVVVGALLAWAVPLGFLVGIAVRHAMLTVEPIARNKTAVSIVVMLAYFALLFTDTLGAATAAAFPFLAALPPGWFGDLLVAGVPGLAVSPLRIAAATALTALAVPALVGVAARIAEIHWLSDPVLDDDDPEVAGEESGGSAIARATALLPAGVGRPTRAVVRTTLLRARRSPVRLIYLLYPTFAAFPLFQEVVTEGTIPGHAPWMVSGFVVWAAGAAFTLNVLGDQGATLPVLLSSPDSGRHLVAGNVLAGVLVALVPGVAVAALVGALGHLGAAETLALAAVTAVGVVGAALLATGIGVAFPRFGTVRVAGDREATAPSKSAFAVYSLLTVVFVPVCWLLASASAPGALADLLGAASALQVRAAAGAGLVAWLGLAAGSALLALRRVESHTV